MLFALPSLVWALGYGFGASTTLSPDLLRLAADRGIWFRVVLWATVVLKLVAAAIGGGPTLLWGISTGRCWSAADGAPSPC